MKRTTVLFTSVLALSACSSSPGPGKIVAQDSGDTVQAKLIEGNTVNAQPNMMSAVLVDRETGTVTRVAPSSFGTKLPSGTDEDITMIVNGEEITFSADERQLEEDGVTFYGWSQDEVGGDRRFQLWTWANGTAGNSISLSGDSFVNVWEYFVEEADNSEATSFNVTGIETADSALNSLGTASYQGYADVKAYPIGSYDGFDTVDRLQSNNAMLEADFGAGTISGSLEELNWGWSGGGREAIDGAITMEEAAIASDGRYSGTLSPDTAFQGNGVVSTTGGTYSGDFFGPVADATAGSIQMDFESGGTDYEGSGFFNARKQD